MSNLTFTFAGVNLGLSETPVKNKDHTYHTFRTGEKASFTGEQVPALAEALPDFVIIDGVTINLLQGKTSATVYKSTEVIPEADRRARASAQGTATFPTIGEPRSYSVAISVTKAGTWNVKTSVFRTASVSPEDRKVSAQTKAAANFAALQAVWATA